MNIKSVWHGGSLQPMSIVYIPINISVKSRTVHANCKAIALEHKPLSTNKLTQWEQKVRGNGAINEWKVPHP